MAALDIAVIITAVAGVVYVARKRIGRARPSPEAWRAEAVSLTRDCIITLEELEPSPDHDHVQRAVLPLVGRFDRLVREAPTDIDDELLHRLYSLGVECRKLGIERPHRTKRLEGRFAGEPVSDLLTRARTVVVDIEDAFNTVTE